MNVSQFAAKFDLPERSLLRLVSDDQTEVEVKTVDRFLTQLGVPWLLEEWYPLDELGPLPTVPPSASPERRRAYRAAAKARAA